MLKLRHVWEKLNYRSVKIILKFKLLFINKSVEFMSITQNLIWVKFTTQVIL